MKSWVDFAMQHPFFIFLMLLPDMILTAFISRKAAVALNEYIREAAGPGMAAKSLYGRSREAVRQVLQEYGRSGKGHGFYRRTRDKMKRSGYRGEHAAAVYLALMLPLPLFLFLATMIAIPLGIARSLLLAGSVPLIVESVAASEKKKHHRVFQRNVYKIYKYLYNQVSAGVTTHDAIRTLHEVIGDTALKSILIRFAASYELSLDIDFSLEEFRSNFDADEVETLCTAIKQGIMTGDNRQILARQEDIMFKQYFNRIQAETDGCRIKSALSAAMFTLIVIIMIAVPLFHDVSDAVGKIFVN